MPSFRICSEILSGEKTVLTRKQSELLLFINKRLNDAGVSPSFDEMKEALRLKSKSGIHRLITGLEERGFLRRLPHRARALQVLKLPDAAALPAPNVTPLLDSRRAGLAEGREGFVPQVIRGERVPLSGAIQAANEAQALSLPLYGRIAAGTPIEALRDNSTTVDVPVSLLGSGAHYCLEVQGDSMIDAGIQDGDIAIIKSADTAESGEIIVALIDDAEATLKRLRKKGASIALEPANASYETRIFGPDRVKIQGRLAGLYRRYN
jgi:repressor LexA